MAFNPTSICPKISLMTGITVKIDWPLLVLAILIGPTVATTLGVLLSLVFPPALPVAMLVGIFSLCLGFLSYLILAGPLMILAQWLGGDHPLIHAGIGYGAVWLIPSAHALGVPGIAAPELVEPGQWFAPFWCATAACSYTFLRREFTPEMEA